MTPAAASRAPTFRPSSFVGAVTDTGPQFPTRTLVRPPSVRSSWSTRPATRSIPTGRRQRHHAECRGCARLPRPAGQTPDPLYDATDPTPGGGDTGSVLISPFITPGTVSTSTTTTTAGWRTMEDLFNVSARRRHRAAVTRRRHRFGRPRRPGAPRVRRPGRTPAASVRTSSPIPPLPTAIRLLRREGVPGTPRITERDPIPIRPSGVGDPKHPGVTGSAGSLRRPGRCRALAAVIAALLTAGLAAGSLTSSAGATQDRTHPSGSGLVGYPSFLPRGTLHVRTDALLVGTPRRPALTSEGDAVKVVTAHWAARATVVGPEIPGEGLPYRTPATTCTWTVTLAKASGRVPIAVSDFEVIDSLGGVLHPYLVPGRPAPPRILRPGRTVTFELRAAEPVGQGDMRWSPVGGHAVATWDFVVEND